MEISYGRKSFTVLALGTIAGANSVKNEEYKAGVF
jgi:hypothetical protein